MNENLVLVPKPEHGSEAWLRNRWKDDKGFCTFGASDAAALMNASPYTSRGDLYKQKALPPLPSINKAVFQRGNDLEPALISVASRMLGVPIITPQVQYRKGRFTVSKDGVDNEQKPTIGVEAKTTTRYSISDADDLPQEWLWQGWAQQFVLDVPIFFITLDKNQSFSLVELPKNDAAQNALLKEAEMFGEMIDSGEMLEDLDQFNSQEIALLFRAKPESIELPATAVDWLWMLEDARATKKQAEDQETKAKDAIARMMLNYEVGLLNGETVVSWKESAGKVSLDTTALKYEHPELCKQYEKQGAPFRTMRVVHPKKGKKNDN